MSASEAVQESAAPANLAKPIINPLYVSILAGFHLLTPIAFFEPFFTWWWPAYLLIGNFIFGSIGINLAYHRLLTHRSLEVPKWLEKLFVMCGVCSLETPPYKWVCIHRMHHQKSDEEEDPHSPKKNFLWVIWVGSTPKILGFVRLTLITNTSQIC